MKTKDKVVLTLAAIIGLTGSTVCMKEWYYMKDYEKLIPPRLIEIDNELIDMRKKYHFRSLDYMAVKPKAQEDMNKFKELVKEKETYLEDSVISNARKKVNEPHPLFGVFGSLFFSGLLFGLYKAIDNNRQSSLYYTRIKMGTK